jgi:glycosyltransferase involved in cell wall biosynthesis
MNISPVIIVKNASRTIAQTLESLKEFDEIIVYDTGSEDNSIDIARNYPNVKLCKGKFSGFGKTKNKAAFMSKNDWIFSIDADEVVSPQLMDSIRGLCLDDSCVYRLKRYNYYRKRRIRYSGWGQEYVTRIYNKSVVCFNEKLVHEHINIADHEVVTLEGELRHFSYSSVSDFIQKRDLYSELFAKENMGRRKSSPGKAFVHAAFDFFNTYFIKLALFDGYRGLLIAVLNANVSFYKYLKLYEANIKNDARVSLIMLLDDVPVKTISRLIESALNQTVAPDEIVIATNIKNQETVELLKSYSKTSFIPIHLSGHEDEINHIEPCNFTIGIAACEYLIFIDGNGVLHKNFVHDHLKFAKKGYYISGANVLIDSDMGDKALERSLKSNHNFFWNKIGSLVKNSILGLNPLKPVSIEQKGVFANISFYKDELSNINDTLSGVFDFEKMKADLLKKMKYSKLSKRKLHFSGIHYQLSNLVEKSNIFKTKKVLVCLDRLKHPNCGLGQVSLNMGRKIIQMNDNLDFDFSFLLPANGYREFENKIKTINLYSYRYFFSGYMKKFDVCHVTHQLPSYNFGKARRNLLTIHDLNFLYTKKNRKKQKYLKKLQNNIYKADAIAFISEFTKQTCYEYLNIPSDKITQVVYNGVEAPPLEFIRPEWLDGDKFLFSIGQFLEKKNFHVLLPFIKLLPDDIKLVIAGENNTHYGKKMNHLVNEHNLHGRVIIPGGITDRDRNYLYHHCGALLFPSTAEGFGLPVIEAMLSEKPVFCSNRTSLAEIGGGFAFFWDDFNPKEMLEVYNKGMKIFEDKEYQKNQMDYAKSFTYERNIQEYMKIYKKLIDL